MSIRIFRKDHYFLIKSTGLLNLLHLLLTTNKSESLTLKKQKIFLTLPAQLRKRSEIKI